MPDSDAVPSKPSRGGPNTPPEPHSSTAQPPPNRMEGRGTTPQGIETEIWQGRTHVGHYGARFVVWGLLNLAATVLIIWTANRVDWIDWARALLAIFITAIASSGVILGKILIRVLGTRYRITSERLFVHRGILNQTIDQSELIRVDDVRVYKTLMDRMFDLGTIGIVSTDSSDNEFRIEGIPQPEKIAEAIRGRTRAMRSRTMYVENL